MKVLISLVVGLLGGIAFSIAYPDLALRINGQREKLMNEGKEQALTALHDALDKKITTAQTSGSGAKPAGFAGFAAGIGGSGKTETDTLKETKSLIEQQLAEVKAKK
ncbi:MAG TPA: hypothetical protein VF796_22685 [Humisphaera sp.]